MCTHDSSHSYREDKNYLTHNYELVESIEPTCTQDGYIKYVCKHDYEHINHEIIDATGHNEIIDEAVSSTCVTPGLTKGSHCSICKVILVPQIETGLDNHENARVCSYCGVVNNNYYTEGLSFTKKQTGENKYYYEVSVGTATSSIIYIPDYYDGWKVSNIKDNGFRSNKTVQTVYFGANITYVGNNAFDNCTNLTNVIMNDGVSSIGESAFSGCALTTIVIQKSVKGIANYAFSGCPLETVYYKGTEQEWGEIQILNNYSSNYALYNATKIYNYVEEE